MWWVVVDRGRGGLAIGAGGEERVGEMIVVVGGHDDFRQPSQRRRSDVLPPPTPRTGRGIGGTPS